MSLDPQLAQILKLLSSNGRKPAHEYPVPEARANFRALTYDMVPASQQIQVECVQDIQVDGGSGTLEARCYRPTEKEPVPTIAFFHGGGFVMGDLDTHDSLCRELCRSARAVVVAIDYRLAPEHCFPAAVDDALAATRWVLAHQGDLGGAGLVGVAGDSAGGNLAAVVAQQLTEEGLSLSGQLLIYPALDVESSEYPSMAENARGYFLEADTMAWFIEQYLGEANNTISPRFAPIRTESLSGQPPALIVTAQYDPLRDQGTKYAEELTAAGCNTKLIEGAGMIHGFANMGHLSAAAQNLIESMSQKFGEMLYER